MLYYLNKKKNLIYSVLLFIFQGIYVQAACQAVRDLRNVQETDVPRA